MQRGKQGFSKKYQGMHSVLLEK